jgi:hypothetical protein
LTGHNRASRTGFLKISEQPVELPDSHPFDGIGVIGKLRAGFFLEGSDVNCSHAMPARRSCQEKWIKTIAGNNSQRELTFHAGDLNGIGYSAITFQV